MNTLVYLPTFTIKINYINVCKDTINIPTSSKPHIIHRIGICFAATCKKYLLSSIRKYIPFPWILWETFNVGVHVVSFGGC